MRILTFMDDNSTLLFMFFDDHVQTVGVNTGLFGSRLELFPGSDINWDKGYFTRADGIIVCASECSDPDIIRFHGQDKKLLITHKCHDNG